MSMCRRLICSKYALSMYVQRLNIYAHICVCIYILLCIHTYILLFIHICILLFIRQVSSTQHTEGVPDPHLCNDDFVYIYMYICVFVCIHKRYVYTYTCIHTHVHYEHASMWCRPHMRPLGKYRSLLQNIVCFMGLFCKKDLYFKGAYLWCRPLSMQKA